MLVADSFATKPTSQTIHKIHSCIQFFISFAGSFLWLTLLKMLFDQMFFHELKKRTMTIVIFCLEEKLFHRDRIGYSFTWRQNFVRWVKKRCRENRKPVEMRTRYKNQFQAFHGNYKFYGSYFHKFLFVCSSYHKCLYNLIKIIDAVLNRWSNYMHSAMFCKRRFISLFMFHFDFGTSRGN